VRDWTGEGTESAREGARVIKERADPSPFRLPLKVETGMALRRKDDRK